MTLSTPARQMFDDIRAFLIEYDLKAKYRGYPVTVNANSVENGTVEVRLAPEADRLNLYTPSVRVDIAALTDKQVVTA